MYIYRAKNTDIDMNLNGRGDVNCLSGRHTAWGSPHSEQRFEVQAAVLVPGNQGVLILAEVSDAALCVCACAFCWGGPFLLLGGRHLAF